MHIHILGICGTFMGGLALIARAAGHKVTGCDTGVYPPMSTQLQEQGIDLIEGYQADQISLQPDLFIIGNVVSRGNVLMEAILDQNLPYMSGPQWLGENILQHQHVLAVAGTHGKTTTSSMLAYILQHTNYKPNFLIGGIAPDLGVSALYKPENKYFVIEADEYDTAFFDKRSKFLHYRANTAIFNNLEFDHADIFADLAAIETQFHHFVRTIPASGTIIRLVPCEALDRVVSQGIWSATQTFGTTGSWQIEDVANEPYNNSFNILQNNTELGTVQWQLTGEYNRMNALAAIAAANTIGIKPAVSAKILSGFGGVKRRMELRGTVRQVSVYDDFAHHPTAIQLALKGARRQFGQRRIIAVLEPRSNTMKLGSMAAKLPEALNPADLIFCYGETQGKHALGWNAANVLKPLGDKATAWTNFNAMVTKIAQVAQPDDIIIVMSNGSFGGIHEKLLTELGKQG